MTVGGVPGSDSSHVSLIAQMQDDEVREERHRRGEDHVDDVERAAEPHDRPDDRAQWDEVRGIWIEWDQASGTWVPAPGQVETERPPGDETGTGSAAPGDEKESSGDAG